MSDPIDRLSSFDPGVPVPPMTPADVRRRGDRRRRRRAVALVAGAALAVIAVATPLAVIGDDGEDQVTPAVVSLSAERDLLEADEVFPLADLEPWAETSSDDLTLACQPDSLDSLDPMAGEDVLRRQLEADVVLPPGTTPDPEAPDAAEGRIREAVLLFADDDAAARAYETVAGWVDDCAEAPELTPSQDAGVRTLPVDGGRAEWQLRTSSSAQEVCGDVDCDAARFDRMGVAQVGDRLVVFSLAQIGGPLQPEGLDQAMDAAFTAAIDKARPGVDEAPEPTSPPGPSTTIPGDFPLDQGLVADPDLGERTGPSSDATGVVLPEGWCGADVWPADGVQERLATTVTGPEYSASRELVTFTTTQEAVSLLSRIGSAVVDCPKLAGDTPGDDLTFRLQPDDTGVASTTFSAFYAEGVSGNAIYQFVQVGNTVLATVEVGEMSLALAPESALELSRRNAPLIEELCALTGSC